jgi:hypothetical protein
MTTATTARDSLMARYTALAELDDTNLAAQFLARQQAHTHHPPQQLHRWAQTATEAGRAQARAAGCEPTTQSEELGLNVVETTGGLRPGWVVVAEYHERRSEVRLYLDALDLAEQLVEQLGWQDWYPAGSLRHAAIAHEIGHRQLHGRAARELRTQLGLLAFRIGRIRRYGHVAGTPELFAHAYAQQACGLDRSPLLITNALALAAGARTAKDDG